MGSRCRPRYRVRAGFSGWSRTALTKLAPEERKAAEQLARDPLGRVPALELDDGAVVFESAAICLRLADLHPDAGVIALLESAERALVCRWVCSG